MFLVDTNVWLELILDQDRSGEVRTFFHKIPAKEMVISEFSLYSIAIILSRLKKENALVDFIADTMEEAGISRIRLGLDGIKYAVKAGKKFKLDFDDAYQYAAAEKFKLTIVSFDADFDRTPIGKKTPAQI